MTFHAADSQGRPQVIPLQKSFFHTSLLAFTAVRRVSLKVSLLDREQVIRRPSLIFLFRHRLRSAVFLRQSLAPPLPQSST